MINKSILLRSLLLVAVAAFFVGCATPDYSGDDPGYRGHESHDSGGPGGSCH